MRLSSKNTDGFGGLFRRRPGVVFALIAIGFVLGFVLVAAVMGKGAEEVDPNTLNANENTFSSGSSSAPDNPDADTDPNAESEETAPAEKSNDLQTAADAAAAVSSGVPIGVAIGRLGSSEVVVAGDKTEFKALSTTKVPVAAAYLREFETFNTKSLGQMKEAIVNSNNEAVRALFLTMKSKQGFANARQSVIDTFEDGEGPIENVPTKPDPEIENALAIGTATWSVENGVAFYREFANGCVAPKSEAGVREILNAMRGVQGLGRFGAVNVFKADRTFTKGGWDSSGGDTTQFAIIGRGDDALVIGVTVGDTSFANGKELIGEAMAAIDQNLDTPRKGVSLPRTC